MSQTDIEIIILIVAFIAAIRMRLNTKGNYYGDQSRYQEKDQ